jgi:hypothetical protein
MKLSFWTFPFAALASATLLGCASHYGASALKTGATVSEVTAALGTPTGRYSKDGGERIEYAKGPYGKHTYMLDFDSQGRLVKWEQVLTENRFDAVQRGVTRDDVLYAIGHPSEQKALPVQGRTLWSYRYDAPFCKWFQVGLDAGGKVVDTGYGPDPLCDDFQTGVQ